jgi:hypothetical protein
MSEPRSDKVFRLDVPGIVQLLGCPDFYVACPAYFYLRAQGLETYRRHMRAIATRGTPDHVPEWDNLRMFGPLLGSFVKHTIAMHETDPAMLEPFYAYLTKKLGYRPTAVLLTYRDGKESNELLLY